MAGQQSVDESGPGKPETMLVSARNVDVQRLADRVYRLMVGDARLAQARSAVKRRKE